MTISGITTGTNTFTATSGSTTVAGGDSTVLTVKFTPTAFGTFTDTLTVVSDGGTLKIALSGSSPIPTLTSLKTSITYSKAVRNTTIKDTLKITNNSINTLIVDSIYTKTTIFVVDRTNGAIGTDTLNVVVSFTPTAIALYTDTLYLRNNSVTSFVKIPLSGNCTTGIEDVTAGIPVVYSLAQNFPNPFNPSTTLRYGLPARSSVRLVIYNVLGQVVKELVNTEQKAGYQSVVWNANVSSGLYFYRIEAISKDDPSKRFVETKKMLMLK